MCLRASWLVVLDEYTGGQYLVVVLDELELTSLYNPFTAYRGRG